VCNLEASLYQKILHIILHHRHTRDVRLHLFTATAASPSDLIPLSGDLCYNDRRCQSTSAGGGCVVSGSDRWRTCLVSHPPATLLRMVRTHFILSFWDVIGKQFHLESMFLKNG
ncbi:hypothetical protein M8C21_028922, partial [Ambrosia artemisiifolia]